VNACCRSTEKIKGFEEMKFLKGILKLAMKVTLVFVVVIVRLFFALKYWLSHPSDEMLISNFNANKTEELYLKVVPGVS
jgi:hypothetical protein